MKYFLYLFGFFYFHTAICKKIILSVGEKMFFKTPANYTIHINTKALLKVKQNSKSFSILAKKPGHTMLLVGKQSYNIFIFHKDQKQQAKRLDAVIKKCWGLSFAVSDTHVFQVKGRLNRLSDWLDLVNLSKKHHITYQFQAKVDKSLQTLAEIYMKSLFKNKVHPNILWNQMPFAKIPKEEPIETYANLLKPWGLIPKPDPLWFSNKKFIKLEIALIEKISSSGLSFGGKQGLTNVLINFSSLLSFLNFLKNSGQGKTLHHSSVIGQSGKTLEISSGGQIPFNNYNIETQTKSISWKSYGLNLSLVPKVDNKFQILLDIKAKFSEPLAYASAAGPPPLKIQSLKNTIVLKDKQIIKLFQMYKNSKGSQTHGQHAFMPPFATSLFKGQHTYKVSQQVFIQAHIINNVQKKLAVKSIIHK